ncbi:hypothetical protein EDC52_101311 [Biostraticola tofi]|uniref:Uncharacterized protein n=1 Tax=Biostraticola tofi TaxID=466109 RepID=A0A4R3Z7E1_9GAMM|nr:hypothetical protein EDC52_101311 [Biostraticola tofi]
MTLSRSVLRVCSVLLVAGLLSSTTLAAAPGNTAPDQDKPQYPDAAAFPAYVEQLKAQALALGIRARVVE